MSIFSGLNRSSSDGFGIGITSDSKPIAKEISDIGNRIVKNNKKAITELTKYKQVNELNRKLSQSYRENLVVMIDISRLLNSYAGFFDLLKGELERNERTLGDLELKDIENIESLTREKMDRFNNEFMNQSEKIKGWYRKYGLNDEFNRLTNLQQGIPQITGLAEQARGNIRSVNASNSQRSSWFGGNNKKGEKKKKT